MQFKTRVKVGRCSPRCFTRFRRFVEKTGIHLEFDAQHVVYAHKAGDGIPDEEERELRSDFVAFRAGHDAAIRGAAA